MSSPLEELERLKVEYDVACELFDGENGDQYYERWQEARTMFVAASQEHLPYLLTAAREAETLRAELAKHDETRMWLNQQLDDIRFYSGTSSRTYEVLVEKVAERLNAAFELDAARQNSE